jgi:hypothetical protein
MKKLIVTILALVYLGTSTGATVSMHYCMGKLVKWTLGHSQQNKCDNCGMEKKNAKGCCKDEYKQLKAEKDQKAAESVQLMQLASIAIPIFFVEIPSVGFTSLTEENPFSHAPPRSNEVAAYIRNCVFRI